MWKIANESLSWRSIHCRGGVQGITPSAADAAEAVDEIEAQRAPAEHERGEKKRRMVKRKAAKKGQRVRAHS